MADQVKSSVGPVDKAIHSRANSCQHNISRAQEAKKEGPFISKHAFIRYNGNSLRKKADNSPGTCRGSCDANEYYKMFLKRRTALVSVEKSPCNSRFFERRLFIRGERKEDLCLRIRIL